MDRAEAIKVLNFYRNCHYTEPLGTEERELADAINEILPHYAALREQEQSKWISVKERLPEPFISVLVYMPEERPLPTVHEGYVTRQGTWYAHFFEREPFEITHWMPLPEPPKGE